MLHGTFSVPRVEEESVCRTSKKYQFTDAGIYRIHSNSLMPDIPFAESAIETCEVDESIFVNDEETKLRFQPTIKCQNFLTTRYIGSYPLEYYADGQYTEIGRQFVLICRGGNPTEEYRVFGTEAAIRGYNPNASENRTYAGGGET